jgi:hypothetical protein
MIVLGYMSSTVALESAALREKLLSLLKEGIPKGIIDDIEWLVHESGKGLNILNKINNILDKKPQDKLFYSTLEWAAAYIIAHEQKKLKELIDIYESSFIKHKHNRELSDHIRNAIYSLNKLINGFVEEIKEIRNDNVHNITLENLEKTNSIIKYLVDVLDKIEQENKQLLEGARASREKIKEAIIGILEKL